LCPTLKIWGRELHFDPAAALSALVPWDVIFPFDKLAKPGKFKMWLCVSKEQLSFLRISSEPYRPCCISIRADRHAFLAHDSFVGCGGDLITLAEADLLDAMARQDVVERQGVVGCIHAESRAAICAALRTSEYRAPAQLAVILPELGCA
jgi:hypothetical protein